MTVLQPVGGNPDRSVDAAAAEAGGRYLALGSVDPADVIAEARRLGVRALQVRHPDLGFLAGLPELEFLQAQAAEPVADVVNGLVRLRELAFNGSWQGRVDLTALPALEWLFVTEADKDRGLETLLDGHPALHHLAVGRWLWADLSAVAALPSLRRLEVFNARRLTSVAGLDAVGSHLQQLSLATCPKLASLDGIEALEQVEYVRIESCTNLTTVDWAVALPRLRYLDVLGQKRIETLKPLAGHPSLEVVAFPKLDDGDLDALAEVPNLVMIQTGRHTFNRDPADFPQMDDFDRDAPTRAVYRRLALG